MFRSPKPRHRRSSSPFLAEALESRRLLSTVTVNLSSVHQTIRALGGDAARVVWANDNNATDPVGDWATSQLHPQMMRVAIPWPQWQPTSTGGTQDSGRVRVTVAAAGATTIQAENFDNGGEGVAYHDAEAQNLGGQYRPSDGVDIENTGDTGGGYDVGWTHAGEWLGYTTSVANAGSYNLDVRAANYGAGGAFHVEVDGVNVTGALAVPNTGGFQAYTDVVKSSISLSAGQHFVKLAMDGNSPYGFSGNFNRMTFTSAAPPPPPPAGNPYGGTPWPVPGTIEAENFDLGGEGVAYHDTTPQNEGSQYRTAEGVDIENTGDAGGGYDVGWTHAGEWMNYTITIPAAATYDLAARVAAGGGGGTFHVEFAGADKTGVLAIPNTGSWQSYTTVAKTGISLAAGTYVMKVSVDSNGPYGFAGNFNWFKLTASGTPAAVESAKNLLFFGNSFTLNNGGLPAIVADVADADGHTRPNVFTQASFGWTLTDQLNQLAADGSNNIIRRSLPAGASWSDVVYQDFSTRPTSISAPPVNGDAAGFRSDAANLFQQVRAYSPKVLAVPLETWARGPDNTVLYPAGYSGPSAMQSDLLANYQLAANDANATYGAGTAALAKAGEAWRALGWSPALYDAADEYHPSQKGSVLAGLMAYRTIYHEKTSDIAPAAIASFLTAHSLSAADWAQVTATADSIS